MKQRLIFILLLGLGLTPNLYAQSLRFEDFPEVSPYVWAIYQDYEGFLWIGTGEGLYRYDGHRFKRYIHIPGDTTSLSWSNSLRLYEDRSGTLWIRSGSSNVTGITLNRYNRQTDNFTRFTNFQGDSVSLLPPIITAIHEDGAGVLWTGTADGELYWLDQETETFHQHFYESKVEERLNSGRVHVIHEDLEGTLWIGTIAGLGRFDREGQRLTIFKHDPRDPTSIGRGTVQVMLNDSKGRYWIGLSEGGLCQMDRQKGTFSCYRHDPDDPWSLSDNHVSTIHEDASGALWVGTNGGLNRFYPETGRFERFYYDQDTSGSLNSNNVRSVLQDRSGVLWIGTWGGGLEKLNYTTPLFSSYLAPVPDRMSWSITEDRMERLWMASRDGIHHLDRGTGQWTSFVHNPDDPASLSHGIIRAIYEDRSGVLWIGTGNGLDRFDEESGTFEHFRHDPEDPKSISANIIERIFEDRKSRFWVGTRNGGLNLMDRSTGQFTRFVHDALNPASISFGSVEDFLEDSQGRFWVTVSGDGGLNLMDQENGTFTRLVHDPNDPNSLGSNDVISLVEDSDGMIWIGSFNGGLNRFDPESGLVRRFNTDNSCLPHDTILAILQDDEGFLWLNTNRGIVRFNPEQVTCTTYDTNDGLVSLAGLLGSHKSQSGEFFFGTFAGVHGFYPAEIPISVEAPPVVLTEFRLFNNPVVPGPESLLHQRISDTEQIVLTAAQHNIGFDFAALTFNRPEQNQYAYMLEGFDEDWFYSGNQNSATYTNLSPGNYTFRVKGANPDGLWNENSASVDVVILPPWWRTTWAYVVYGLAFVIGVFGIDRFQRKRLIANERLRAEREKAKAIETTNNELQRALKHLTETQDQLIHTEKMASLGLLTAGIAHEINNPLNFVNNFAKLASDQTGEIESVLEKEKERLSTEGAYELKSMLDDLKLNAQMINVHGQRAGDIIRSMLEHSRTDRGERQVVVINKLVDEYTNLAYHGIRTREEGFVVTLERDYDDEIEEVEIYPKEIGRVLINLLDNAFYTVNEKRLSLNGQYTPRVWVNTKKVDGKVAVEISDNGMGIPEEIREKIFEPFFTTKPAGSGTGLGLSLSYDIVVKGHGGNLFIESEEREGTTFVISLPVVDTLTE